jgi:co-chaperonin GroES (HSP10)
MIKPIGSMLLIEKIEQGDKTTKTGLVISAAFTDSGPKQGKVIDMGDGEFNYKGDLIPILGIDIDDIIYYPEHSGTDIEDENGNKVEKSKSGENFRTVMYEKIVPLLIEAVKELKARVDRLENE